MLETIQTKINNLQNGKKLILGSGIKMDEMQKLIALCENLQAEGVIKIVKINQNAQSDKKVSDSIIVEKI
ncbi:hypothetical protein GCM10023345_25870 [Acinetobacter kookii]|uniref:Uncharacterized protein n=1 Tax=Acinetobacter kookii TaxID=1226327 RepID=A0A1G6N5U8_9GAMM|nr:MULTISPECIES: hypothetical protein [Acinetobacter]MCT8090760.1 hypothetical protein [Acinetobacter sp. F_3_1]MCT8099188.1 hypothetical protein [Acinetobacter sp. C_3_1]MCT8102261.1 hypothetical protein [Acinetobacter sp. C_4_1]MCT8136008.1 hypothetical protein [Acinetobacter sp. T_3_1]TCB65281.1 hypothetical protein E0H88_14175 [Acinetobacter sp. ANC 4216]